MSRGDLILSFILCFWTIWQAIKLSSSDDCTVSTQLKVMHLFPVLFRPIIRTEKYISVCAKDVYGQRDFISVCCHTHGCDMQRCLAVSVMHCGSSGGR